MQILQAAHGLLWTKLQRLTNCLTSRQGGGAANPVLQSITTDGIGVSNRLTPFGGVDDQGDLVIFDHVDDVWATLGNLVDAAHRQTNRLNHLGGARGRD